MNLKVLSNKTLVRFLSELRGAMDIAAEKHQDVEYRTLEKLYNEAMSEFRDRVQNLLEFGRFQHS